MPSEDAHFRLRLPVGLHKQLAEFAKENHRSINAEIVARLQRSVDWEKYDLEAFSEDIEKMKEDIENLKDQVFPNRYNRD